MRPLGMLFLCAVLGSSSLVPASDITKLSLLTSNNTSSRLPAGDESGSHPHVSEVNIHDLAGRDVLIFGRLQVWFGAPAHLDVGYTSSDPAQVQSQLDDMQSRGLDGVVVDWGGQDLSVEEDSLQVLVTELQRRSTKLPFAIMLDMDRRACGGNAPCNLVPRLIADLTHASAHFESSPAYMRNHGRPVVFVSGKLAAQINWDLIAAEVPGHPLFVVRDSGLVPRQISLTGPNTYIEWDWPFNRNCGREWLAALSWLRVYGANRDQNPYLLLPWNNYESGVALESGIDSCVTVDTTISGRRLSWSIRDHAENVDRFRVFLSRDGEELTQLADLPADRRSVDLSNVSQVGTLYVEAVAKPSLTDSLSGAIVYQSTLPRYSSSHQSAGSEFPFLTPANSPPGDTSQAQSFTVPAVAPSGRPIPLQNADPAADENSNFVLGSGGSRREQPRHTQIDRSGSEPQRIAVPSTAAMAPQSQILNGIRFADHYASIQAAIDDLPVGGGDVYIPAGTYALGSTGLKIAVGKRGVRLHGSGPESTIIAYAGSGTALSIGNSSGETNRVDVDGMTFDLSNAAGSANGIVATRAGDLVLDQVMVIGPAAGSIGTGIQLAGTGSYIGQASLHNVRVSGNFTRGIDSDGPSTNTSNAHLFSQVSVSRSTRKPGTGTIGFHWGAGSGDGKLIQVDVEGFDVGYQIDGRYLQGFVRSENNTTGVVFGATSQQNVIWQSPSSNTADVSYTKGQFSNSYFGISTYSFTPENGSASISTWKDAAFWFSIQAGSAADQYAGFRFVDRLGHAKGHIGKTSGNAMVILDGATNARLVISNTPTNDSTDIQALGNGAVNLNKLGGTGGVCFGSGANTCPARTNSAGKGTFSEVSTPKLSGITDTAEVANLHAATATHATNAGNADAVDSVHVGGVSAGHAMCWKDATHMGYCSTAVDAKGTCTCN